MDTQKLNIQPAFVKILEKKWK